MTTAGKPPSRPRGGATTTLGCGTVELSDGLLKALIGLCSTLTLAVVSLAGAAWRASVRATAAAKATAELPSVIAHGDGNGTPGVQPSFERVEAKLDQIAHRVESLGESLERCRQSEDLRSSDMARRLLAVENRHFAAGRSSAAGGGQ